MDGDKRRTQIIKLLRNSSDPLSGSLLAAKTGVSRQVIVQDIALLRATDKNILSTNKGYILYQRETDLICKKVLAVSHTDEQMQDELYTIVDAGARVRDVIVEHEVYGQIAVDLVITSRRDVDEFIERIHANQTKPLKELTNNVHYHTIDALDEATLEMVTKNLGAKGILISD